MDNLPGASLGPRHEFLDHVAAAVAILGLGACTDG